MDDEEKKDTGTGTILILGIFIIAISGSLLYYINPIIGYFVGYAGFLGGIARSVYVFIVVISFPVALILLIGTIISVERLKVIRKKEKAIYGSAEAESELAAGSGTATIIKVKSGAKGSPEITNRWRKIVELADSQNQNDWKQAIIDADSILDEMLTKMNYHGPDLGSKLRSATPADFKTLEQAGEAHGVRNRIAHDGSNFLMSQHEAKRVINMYRQVFEEFFFI